MPWSGLAFIMEGSREMQGTVGLGRAALRAAPGQGNRHRLRGRRMPGDLLSGRRDMTGQSGFGLLEAILAVALVSLGVLALASAFLTLTRVNTATEAQQTVDHAVANYAESLKAAPYRPCSPTVTADYSTAPDLWAPTGPAVVTLQIVSVQYWNPEGASGAGAYQVNCPPGSDGGTQLLTVRAASGDAERQAQIVKRDR
jgi:Tfp pilus assembly protein PilV